MAYAGQILDNPVSGERIIFRKTSADTDGELLEIDLELAPDGHVPGKHVHPVQEERFEVISGTMKFKMGRKTVIDEAGEIVTVPAGVSHKFENGGDETARVRVQVRPALKMEQLFETAVALADEGLDDKSRAVIARRIEALTAAIEAAPKSRRWKLRARVGERKRWYEEPEEVDRDRDG